MSLTAQTSIRLLIVADDDHTSATLLEHFRSNDYTTTTVGDTESALRYLGQSPGYDVALIDVSLPNNSGFSLLEAVQDRSIETSILLVTDRGRLEDTLRGFTLGADDYVVKPCAMEELEARVEAVLRRRQPTDHASEQTHTYSLDNLKINFSSNTCFREGQRIPLTALEFEILGYLVDQRGRVVPREELRDAVWQDRDSICLRTIDRHVAKIRKKLEQNPDLPAYLQTVYGKGYEFGCEE